MSEYIGWIPTLIGNISYSLAGRAEYPYPSEVCIFEYNNTFHYLISQKRITHDSQLGISALIPSHRLSKELEALILQKRGLFSSCQAVLIGSCSELDKDKELQIEKEPIVGKNFQSLNGQVFFIPKTKGAKKLNQILKSSICKINKALSNRESGFCSEKAFEVKDVLEKELKKVCVARNRKFTFFVCDFSLERNGVCYLSSLKKLEKNNDNIIENIDTYDQGQLTDKQAYNQIFFFLKDIFHSHKFHSPDYDTLTQVHKAEAIDILSWAKETLKDFYRVAIGASPEESLGIIYYARAFKEVIKNDSSLSSGKVITDGFSFLDESKSVSDIHAEDVCKARLDERKRNQDNKKWQIGLVATALLLIWNKANIRIFELLEISDASVQLVLLFIVPLTIAGSVLIYIGKLGISSGHQLKKFTRYLSSISKFMQFFTLLMVLFIGFFLLFNTFN